MEQMKLFSSAPGNGGFFCARKKKNTLDETLHRDLHKFIADARKKGCTHIEKSSTGLLFVVTPPVGRDPDAQYVPIDHPQAWVLLTHGARNNPGKKSRTKAQKM